MPLHSILKFIKGFSLAVNSLRYGFKPYLRGAAMIEEKEIAIATFEQISKFTLI